MANLQLFSNNAISLLAHPITAISDTLQVMNGHGDLFPQPTHPGEFFLVTLENEGATHREIIKVTGRSGDLFTGLIRGQENTTPRAWNSSYGDDTLVDHRVTAGTLRKALEPSMSDLTDVDMSTVSTGDVLQWSGTVWYPTSQQAWIVGQNFGPTPVAPGTTQPVNQIAYSGEARGFKFFLTITDITGKTKTLETLVTITGDITENEELVEWVSYGSVGFQLSGKVVCTIDTSTKQFQLAWHNTEALQVRVTGTRIQHFIT